MDNTYKVLLIYPQGRRLTPKETKTMCKLVKEMCANYSDYYKICLPKDKYCFMLHKKWTGGCLCNYFKNAVLPLNPKLEALLTGDSSTLKPCKLCGKPFVADGNKSYCSDACRDTGKKIASAKRSKKYRENKG